MNKPTSIALDIFQVIISVMVSVIPAADMIGKPARLVIVITIMAASASTGIGIGRLIEKYRIKKTLARAPN